MGIRVHLLGGFKLLGVLKPYDDVGVRGEDDIILGIGSKCQPVEYTSFFRGNMCGGNIDVSTVGSGILVS